MDKNVQWINEKKIERTIVNLEKNNIKVISCAMDEESYKNNLRFSKECDRIIPTFGM